MSAIESRFARLSPEAQLTRPVMRRELDTIDAEFSVYEGDGLKER